MENAKLSGKNGARLARQARLEAQAKVLELLGSRSADYRHRHFDGKKGESGAVRWDRDGSREIIDTVQAAVRTIPGLNKQAVARALGISYGTLTKWIEGAKAKAPEEGRPASDAGADKKIVTFEVSRLSDGNYKVSIDTGSIRTFLENM